MRIFIIFLSIIFCSIVTESGRVLLIKGAITSINFFVPGLNIKAQNLSSRDITNYSCEKLSIKLNSNLNVYMVNARVKLGKTFFVGANFLNIDLSNLNKNGVKENKVINYEDYDTTSFIKKYHQGLYFLHEKIDVTIPKIQIKYEQKIYYGAINFEHTPFEKNLGRSFVNFTQDKNFSLNYESSYFTMVNNDFALDFDLDINYSGNKIKVKSKYETNYNSNEFILKDFDVFHNKDKIIHGEINFLAKNLKANLDIKNLDIDRLLNKVSLERNGWIINASLKHQGPLAISNLSGEITARIQKSKYLFKLENNIPNTLRVNAFLNNKQIGFSTVSISSQQVVISSKLKEFHNLLNDFLSAKNSNFESDLKYDFSNKKWQIEKCNLELKSFKFNKLDFMTFDKFTASIANQEEALKLIATIEDVNNVIKLTGTSLIKDNIWKHDYIVNTAKFNLSDKSNIHIPIHGELKFFGEDSDLSLTGEIGIYSGKIKKMDLLNFSAIPKIKISSIGKEENNKFKIKSNITIRINENFTIESKNLIAVLKGKAVITENLFSPEITSEIFISDGYFNVLNKKFVFKKSQIFAANNNIYLLMMANYSDSEYEYIMEISGQLGQNLTIDFSSIPNMPKSKIIPRLILGDNLNKMSPFEAIMLLKKFLNIESDKEIGDYLNIFKLEDFKVTQEDGAVKLKISKKIVEDVIVSVEGGTSEKTEKVISLEKIFSDKLSSYLKSSTKNSIIFGAKLNKFYD